jgi:hypothetical protein
MTGASHAREGMIARRVVMAAHHVVFFKGVLEASEGLAVLFAERGGDLVVAAPGGRARELDALLEALAGDLGLVRVDLDR